MPPSKPITAEYYTKAGYPWFDYYDADLQALNGAKNLAGLKSVAEKSGERAEPALPHNQSLKVSNIVKLRAGLKRHQVRESDMTV